ncbi:MAG: AMP-binding protein [Candidatus Thiodiazotropha sp.]|jgi:long-subunit acyl-CoA synthetase (AMP-forming)
MKLFDRLTQHAVQKPCATAIEGKGIQLNYADLQAALQVVIPQLQALRVDVLALDLDNSPAWALIDLASMACGITLVPLPPFFSAAQLQHALSQAGVKLVISDNPQRLRQRLQGLALVEQDHLQVGNLSLSCLATGLPAQALLPGVVKITYTSGTTAEPKGVMLTWQQIEQVVDALSMAVEVVADDRHVALAPLAVLLENIAGLYLPLWAGATVLLPSLNETGLLGACGLDPERMLKTLHEWAATTAIFSPQMLQGAVSVMEAGQQAPAGLRFIAVGGAVVSKRLLLRAAAQNLPVYEGYGLSEFASVVCLNHPGAQRPGAVGKPLPHIDLKIADDGEVLIRGNRFSGYLGEVPLESEEEWWHSGDIGYLDDEGYLYLRGRRRHIFITAFGRNVSPEWVERELVLESVIAQAALFGEARPWNCAVILPTPGAETAVVEAAIARVNALLPDYARVTQWLLADAPFGLQNRQLTGTGRLRREAIFEHYRERIDALYREELIS